MNTVFLKQFYKDLDKVKDQNVKDCIAKIIINVEEANSLRDIKNLKKLKGYKTVFRIKTGDYRIGIIIEKDIVEFVRFVHRKDIYKRFP